MNGALMVFGLFKRKSPPTPQPEPFVPSTPREAAIHDLRHGAYSGSQRFCRVLRYKPVRAENLENLIGTKRRDYRKVGIANWPLIEWDMTIEHMGEHFDIQVEEAAGGLDTWMATSINEVRKIVPGNHLPSIEELIIPHSHIPISSVYNQDVRYIGYASGEVADLGRQYRPLFRDYSSGGMVTMARRFVDEYRALEKEHHRILRRGKLAGAQFYIWQAIDQGVDGDGLYKMGITTLRDPKERMKQSAGAHGFNARMLAALPFPSQTRAAAIEKQAKQLFPPDRVKLLRAGLTAGADGYTEYRVLSDEERDRLLRWVADQSLARI